MKEVAYLALLLLMIQGCSDEIDRSDYEIPRDSIIGCYKTMDELDARMEITPTEVLINGRKVYTRYQYIYNGGGRMPIMFVYPRLVGVETDDGLDFVPYRGGDGGLTFTLGRNHGRMQIRTITFPNYGLRDPNGRYFSKVSCQNEK